MNALRQVDPVIAELISQEEVRQAKGIELIASENYVSPAVLEAAGSILTNKYAEGYPGRRYYGGCEYHDKIEQIAIDRAKTLFGAEHANVQPHSGASANLAVYMATVQVGDTILAMRLDHGGHLTHGAKVNFSGKLYNIISYGVDAQTGRIDYDEVERLAKEHRPKMIVAGASAYARQIDFERFSGIAQGIDAKLFVDMAHIAGLVAAGLHPSPVPYADYVTTTTHKTLRGPRGGLILCKAQHQKAIDSAVFPGIQGGPLMHIIAAKAVCLHEAMQPEFRQYQTQVILNAKTLAEQMVAYGYDLVSGGTDNHLVLVDLRKKGLTGALAEETLGKVDIICNKNKIPFDPAPATVTSGVRFGTPAITTRGFRESDVVQVAKLVDRALQSPNDDKNLQCVKEDVWKLTSRFH